MFSLDTYNLCLPSLPLPLHSLMVIHFLYTALFFICRLLQAWLQMGGKLLPARSLKQPTMKGLLLATLSENICVSVCVCTYILMCEFCFYICFSCSLAFVGVHIWHFIDLWKLQTNLWFPSGFKFCFTLCSFLLMFWKCKLIRTYRLWNHLRPEELTRSITGYICYGRDAWNNLNCMVTSVR